MSNICSICHEVFTDPVITECGHTFDRKCIQDWFNAGNTTSPITREIITTKLIPNYNLRQSLTELGHELIPISNAVPVSKPLRICILINLNAKMRRLLGTGHSHSKIALAKYASLIIAHFMGIDDELCMLTFGDEVKIALYWTNMNNKGKLYLKNLLDNICTDMVSSISLEIVGIMKAIDMNPTHIIVLSDIATHKNIGCSLGTNIVNYTGIIHYIALGADSGVSPYINWYISKSHRGVYMFCPNLSELKDGMVHLLSNMYIDEIIDTFPMRDTYIYLLNGITLAMSQTDNIETTNLFIEKWKRKLIENGCDLEQIEQNLVNYNSYGKHYIESILSSHLKCMCTSSREPSLKNYIGERKREFLERGLREINEVPISRLIDFS